jgi:hypothetical protein
MNENWNWQEDFEESLGNNFRLLSLSKDDRGYYGIVAETVEEGPEIHHQCTWDLSLSQGYSWQPDLIPTAAFRAKLKHCCKV